MKIEQKLLGFNVIPKDQVVFEIDVYNKCNLNCEYCEMQNNDWNPTNSKDDWNQRNNLPDQLVGILNKINEKQNTKIHLLGGEPTFHKQLSKFINNLNTLDIKLFTNGTTKSLIPLLDKINGQIDIAFSFHIEQIGKVTHIAEKFIDNLHKALYHTSTRNVTVNVLLHNIHKKPNYELVDSLLTILNKLKKDTQNMEIELFFPFDENGENRFTHENEFINYGKLTRKHKIDTQNIQQAFGSEVINLNTIQHLNKESEESKTNPIKQRDCFKNLWLVNYKNDFHKDGTDYSITYELMKSYYYFDIPGLNKKFVPRITFCNSEVCSCPANNPYQKIIRR